MTPDELEAAIRAVGAERYHDKHPFHRLLHGGKLDKGQVQAWALNRYCYQSGVPRKDAALMSRVAGSRAAPRMGASHARPRRYRRRGGRHRALAGADRRAGPRPRLRRLHARRAARHPLRRRGLCQFRARAHAAGGGGLLAHRAVRPLDPPRAHLRHAGELRLHRREGDAIFPPPPRPGQPRRRFRPRLRQAPRCDAARAGRRRRRRALQVQRAVGAARCAAPRLCHARPDPPGAFRPGQS